MGTAYNPMGLDMHQNQEQGPSVASHDFIFDTAAFENAFDLAAAEMVQSDRELDELMSGAVLKDMGHEDLATFEINKTRMHESTVMSEPRLQTKQNQEPVQGPAQASDALSQTAGLLLDSVSHDTSDKFAQSSFLALMRRLRDKEVTVEGEDFIDVSVMRLS